MKLLHITPLAPGDFSGGEIGVRQTLLSLALNGHSLDYVGPPIKNQDLARYYEKICILEPNHNFLLRVYDTLHMNTNQRYRSWLKLNMDMGGYDAVIMDFSRLNYVLDKLTNKKIIVRIHNVEKDYALNNFKHKRNLVNFFENCFAAKREQKIVENAHALIVLTEKDKERLCQLYPISDNKITIIPICMQQHKGFTPSTSVQKEVQLLINGSLWFGPNYEGIRWFLENVYPQLKIPKKLIIAGSNPNKSLLRYVESMRDVVLVDTPATMDPYLKQSDLIIAPIFNGAGMKVKVAEALSYGLPVVGTSHAFEGYDISEGEDSYLANTAQEFIEKITKYSLLSPEQKQRVKENSYQLYEKKYSQECSRRLFQKVLENVVSN